MLVVSNVEKDNKPIGIKRAGWGWHSDGEDKGLPNAGSFIHALKLPPVDSDTMYADTYAAFAALPAGRAAQDHGTPRVLLPRALPRGLLPASAAADRRAEEGAARRLASDRAPASLLRLDVAVHRALGVQDRRHGGCAKRRN